MDVNWNELAGEAVTQMLRIFVLVIKWVVQIFTQLKEKNPQLAEVISYAAQLGYAAAEDYFRDMQALPSEKMSYAIEHADQYLKAVGGKADRNIIRDAIDCYGINGSRYSWTNEKVKDMLEKLWEVKAGGTEPENIPAEETITEEENESTDADHLCVRDRWNDPDADRDPSCEQSAGPDQADAENQNGE